MSDRVTVAPSWLRSAVTSIFTAAGLSTNAAKTVAESLVAAEMRGITSHGALLVPMYVERLLAGSVSPRERAEVVVDAGAIAVLDAHHASDSSAATRPWRSQCRRPSCTGWARSWSAVPSTLAAPSVTSRPPRQAGCIGIAAANTRPLMPAPGGAQAVVGNNPLAVAVPVSGRPPILLDMALSEAALGKIRLAAQEGRDIPPSWATDAAGRTTTDPVEAIAGLLLPAAGHKGYGLALVIDVLTGLLSGGSFGKGVQGLYADTSVPNDCAHFFLAIDVSKFGDREAFLTRAAELTADVLSSAKAPGVDRLLLPGQLEEERYAHAEANGVDLDVSVLLAVGDTAERFGLALPEITSAAGDLARTARREPVMTESACRPLRMPWSSAAGSTGSSPPQSSRGPAGR